MSLTSAEIAQAVAISIIKDCYDSCGDLVWLYVFDPESINAFEISALVGDLEDDQKYEIKELTKRFLEDSVDYLTQREPNQPTLF